MVIPGSTLLILLSLKRQGLTCASLMRFLVASPDLFRRSKYTAVLASMPWRGIGTSASFYSNTRVASSRTSSPFTPRSVSAVKCSWLCDEKRMLGQNHHETIMVLPAQLLWAWLRLRAIFSFAQKSVRNNLKQASVASSATCCNKYPWPCCRGKFWRLRCVRLHFVRFEGSMILKQAAKRALKNVDSTQTLLYVCK